MRRLEHLLEKIAVDAIMERAAEKEPSRTEWGRVFRHFKDAREELRDMMGQIEDENQLAATASIGAMLNHFSEMAKYLGNLELHRAIKKAASGVK